MTNTPNPTDLAGGAAGDIIPVIGTGGLRGTARRPAIGAAVPAATDVVLADGRRVEIPTHLLRPQPDGTYAVALGPADLPATSAAADTRVVPLVAEQLDVQRRRVETGKIRVTKSVQTHEELVDLPTFRDEVTVERVSVERFVSEPPAVRQEGDVTIVPVLEEVLVVEKRLMLREEIRLTVRRTESREAQTVTLRKEVAHVERAKADQ